FNVVHHYSYTASRRLGRSEYKEQYVFVYRSDIVKITDSYQYEDKKGNADIFARAPFIVVFHSPRTGKDWRRLRCDPFLSWGVTV
ncbi:hypothetical protein chiPu_0023997, partial [Chiloscyllium punctatum]|nr:hypothetical protein [Chiloscyllium punctatum]